MKKKSYRTKIIFFASVLICGMAGIVFLGVKDIPAPKQAIEKPLDASRFLK